MTNRDELDILAAEYVLGTLPEAERIAVAARRQREPALEQAIASWEVRLAPLGAYVNEAEPSGGLFSSIEARIARHEAACARQDADQMVTRLQARVSRWRAATVFATGLAACLAGLVVFGQPLFDQRDQRFVAVFQQDDKQPAFILSVDVKTRELTIRPVTAEVADDKSYQLWIVSDRLGPGPQSLGVLGSAEAPTQKPLPGLSTAELERALFGISLEPKGGSPTGKPTGPAIHGRLIPTGN